VSNKVFIIGNGESRLTVDLENLKKRGKVYGCNALYRDYTPDVLVCIDAGMQHEVYGSGYCSNNKTYFRTHTKLPEFMYKDMTNLDALMEWKDGLTISNEKGNRTQFTVNGTDPNQMKVLYNKYKDTVDEVRLKDVLGQHKLFVTWVDDEDKVELIPEDYSGWSAGPTAVRIALEQEKPCRVYLIGFDLGSPNELINNVYKGTDNYMSTKASKTPSVNWINQHAINFRDYPNTTFYKVNPAPLGTDNTCQFIEEWKGYDNLQYIEQDNFHLALDFSLLL
jgi:hypothetical protein|tara:strand:+ start:857 stop:1693 length:837 start_codon:yes stop_codon:yes gene_type:complete